MSRYLTFVVTMSMLVASCGSAAEPITDETTTTVVATSTTTTVAPTSSTTEATTTTATPETTTTAPECAASELSSSLGRQNAAGQELLPGCYFSDAFSARMSFTTTMPMDVILFEHSIAFGPEGVTMVQLDMVLFGEFVGVLPPADIGVHPPHGTPVPDTVNDMPEDLGTWLEEAAQIVIVDSGTQQIDGEAASWWDVTVDASQGDTFECPYGNCIAGPFLKGGNFVLGDNGTQFRIIQLSGTADGLYVWVQSTAEMRAAVFSIMDSLLSEISFS